MFATGPARTAHLMSRADSSNVCRPLGAPRTAQAWLCNCSLPQSLHGMHALSLQSFMFN